MTSIVVVGEDALCCALGAKLVADILPDWTLAAPPINKRGVTKLIPDLKRYNTLARSGRPVLCIADVDRGCAVELLRKWLPNGKDARLLLRLAVTEAESWLLADQEGFARIANVPSGKLPAAPDALPDSKQCLLGLVHRYGNKNLRSEVVSNRRTHFLQGTGYNAHLTDFISLHWSPIRAATRSPSLRRAVARLRVLPQIQTGKQTT